LNFVKLYLNVGFYITKQIWKLTFFLLILSVFWKNVHHID
jgi:hypothetical protein